MKDYVCPVHHFHVLDSLFWIFWDHQPIDVVPRPPSCPLPALRVVVCWDLSMIMRPLVQGTKELCSLSLSKIRFYNRQPKTNIPLTFNICSFCRTWNKSEKNSQNERFLFLFVISVLFDFVNGKQRLIYRHFKLLGQFRHYLTWRHA